MVFANGKTDAYYAAFFCIAFNIYVNVGTLLLFQPNEEASPFFQPNEEASSFFQPNMDFFLLQLKKIGAKVEIVWIFLGYEGNVFLERNVWDRADSNFLWHILQFFL